MNLPILLGRYVEDADSCEMGVTERFYLSRAGGSIHWVDVMHVGGPRDLSLAVVERRRCFSRSTSSPNEKRRRRSTMTGVLMTLKSRSYGFCDRI